MDYATVNAIGITILAIFGLWAFQRGARRKGAGKQPPSARDDTGAQGRRDTRS